MRRGECQARIALARGVNANLVAEERAAPRLVQSDPGAYPIAQAPADGLGVVSEGVGGVRRRPAARVLERLGQVPVIQGRPGLDAGLEQPVDELLVPVEPGG